MAKITGGLLLSFALASCAPVPVQPQPAAHPGSAGSVSSPSSGIPPPSQIGGPQRGQYVWDKVMEGVFMGASIAGPYGAGVGLVFGGLMGLLTADAHYAQLNTQIQTEHAKDKELEAQLERELERQRALDTQVAMAGTPASQASITPVVSKPLLPVLKSLELKKEMESARKRPLGNWTTVLCRPLPASRTSR
jgi:hypothetical protein